MQLSLEKLTGALVIITALGVYVETNARQITIKSCDSMWLVYIFSIEFGGGEHE